MPNPSRPRLRLAARALIALGALIFLFGDRALAAYANINFFLALVIGVLSGLFLMILGYLIHKSLP